MGADTIVAISTPPGRGGIGIVRVAGPAASVIGCAIAGADTRPRRARYSAFVDGDGAIIDRGIVVHYPGPHSYTGDDLVEFQAHGAPVVLDQLVRRACSLGARPARAGEFTERAFRNGRIDLAQAEAVADLIAAGSERAARAARRTLDGEFGHAVHALVDALHWARAELEAVIDFGEDVDAADLLTRLRHDHATLSGELERILAAADRGARLVAGASVAIAGAPNVGKSSLLNRLAAHDRAIVSSTPGTTRDLVEADIVIAGVSVHLIDTAGLRASDEPVEREGMRRAAAALTRADLALLVTDDPATQDADALRAALGIDTDLPETIVVLNKIDTLALAAGAHGDGVRVSALTGAGMDALEQVIVERLGIDDGEGTEFAARRRHLDALERARAELAGIAVERLAASPELAAEHYRLASNALETIAGRYTSEDLLGDIFARFCIGK